MPAPPQPRPGQRLQVKGKPIPFSFWPARRGRSHYALQSLLFALDPWAIIVRAIETRCPKARRPEALACIEQARDFFASATQVGAVSARPLTLYYSFMNVVKAYCLTHGVQPTFDKAQHGLSEQLRAPSRELVDAYLRAFPSPNGAGVLQNFAEFKAAVSGTGLAANTDFDLPLLLPQIVPGHRLWAQGAHKAERFIATREIQFWNEPANRTMWLRIYLVADDLSRLTVSHRRLLTESGMAPSFREVACAETWENRPLICLEQVAPMAYVNYPADQLHELVAPVRHLFWMTVSTVTPYRRYYVYLCPPAERPALLPQLLSIYAISYYLGSITRYRPHHFDLVSTGTLGPRIQDFITGQPLQFIYLMASEFAEQDVTKPAIL
ncbi:YaaC family protein [Methylibium sp.]|uniref:YaaC family protein n=1 Tax=Methylibium sp. TaxID=2067992 RepID=UPI003BA9F153